jgi:RNA polymerase sigma-70 factor (ECF subfamily)
MQPERLQMNTNKHAAITSWIEVQTIVAAYVRSVILNYHDSEDVIQNIAVVFVDKFEQLGSARDLIPWALKVARYEMSNYFRAQNRKEELLDEIAMQRIGHAYQSIYPEADDVKAALHECMKKLHGRYRDVLRLRYFSDKGIGDISRRLGLSKNAVYITLCRAREILANCVRRKTNIQWWAFNSLRSRARNSRRASRKMMTLCGFLLSMAC